MESLEADGLQAPEVGLWAEQKYGLLRTYCQLFSTGMKNKWPCRVYVDLFAGPGRVTIRRTSRIVAGSPTIALSAPDPFDRYVFCEIEAAKMDALKGRVKRDFGTARAAFVDGDVNERAGDVLAKIPAGPGVLCFCVADPFAVANLKFSTIRTLARTRIDFLVLIPSHMDANRNQERLLKPDHPLLDDFLGNRDWREAWREASARPQAPSFGGFLVDQFGHAMASLGYRHDGPGEAEPIRDGGRTLYYLALYSRHPLGQKFWRQAIRYGDRQLRLGFGA